MGESGSCGVACALDMGWRASPERMDYDMEQTSECRQQVDPQRGIVLAHRKMAKTLMMTASAPGMAAAVARVSSGRQE